MGCTVEFLVNKSTIDDIRSFNNQCYHKNGLCEPDICKCSENCQNFTLSVTTTLNMTNHIFGCGGKIEKITTNSFYRVNASVIFDGESKFVFLFCCFLCLSHFFCFYFHIVGFKIKSRKYVVISKTNVTFNE